MDEKEQKELNRNYSLLVKKLINLKKEIITFTIQQDKIKSSLKEFTTVYSDILITVTPDIVAEEPYTKAFIQFQTYLEWWVNKRVVKGESINAVQAIEEFGKIVNTFVKDLTNAKFNEEIITKLKKAA